MDQELERIADVVAARIRAQLGTAVGHAQHADSQPAGEHTCDGTCTSCGHCAEKNPEQVRSIVSNGADRISAAPGTSRVASELAGLIDHTLLKPDATPDQLQKLCDEARRYNFACVCVNSANVSRCRALLGGSTVKVCAVVGFPLGAMSPGAKAFEAREAVRNGAAEIDMVMNIGALKAADYALVIEDISKVVAAARPAKVKVILETGMLSDEEKVAACTLAKLAGAHFVKTSTGFGKGGATAEDIRLMRRVVGAELGVKASGGIRSQEDAARMVEAGASRIGASASVSIVTGRRGSSSY
jgi:deoxyribose-phosphate aldolase